MGSWYNGFSPTERDGGYYWHLVTHGHVKASKPCDACRQDEGPIDLHSEDYSYPYGPHVAAYTFCFACHGMLHSRHLYPRGWDAYRKFVRSGKVAPPTAERKYASLNVLKSGMMPHPYTLYPARARTILDDIHDGLTCPAGRPPGNFRSHDGETPEGYPYANSFDLLPATDQEIIRDIIRRGRSLYQSLRRKRPDQPLLFG